MRSGASSRGGFWATELRTKFSPRRHEGHEARLGLVPADLEALVVLEAIEGLRAFVPSWLVFDCAWLPALVALSFSACAMMRANMAPVSPPFAGRFDRQISGVLSPRISAKSPSLFTLRGANIVMSRSPDHSSRCLIRSQERPSLPLRAPG